MFNCTNLALGGVVDSLDCGFIPHFCFLHHVLDFIGVGVAESLVQVNDLCFLLAQAVRLAAAPELVVLVELPVLEA